jgi:hypothetical protein
MPSADREWSESALIEAALKPITIAEVDLERLTLLFADYLHLTIAQLKREPESEFSDGLYSEITRFTKASSHSDLDDVHWNLLIHPGSIIFSSLLPLLLKRKESAQQFSSAVIAGYHGAVLFAKILHPNNSKKWHATATSGIFGATLATASLLNLKFDQQVNALRLASTAISGGANAPRSQNGATRFTRIQGALMGLTSTIEASLGSPAPLYMIDGAGGMADRFEMVSKLPDLDPTAALHQISLRYFPYSGFSHEALDRLNNYLPINKDQIESIELTLAEPLLSLLGSSEKGRWWSLSEAIATTLINGDPFDDRPVNLDFPIEIKASSNQSSHAKIMIAGSALTFEFGIRSELGITSRDLAGIEKKWRSLSDSSDNLVDLASAIVSGSSQAVESLQQLITQSG